MTINENNSKREELLHTAKMLFYKYGIRRVTVAEICTEAGVSKMTFYKYFANKADIAKTFLLQMSATGMEEYRSIMRQKIPFAEKVQQIVKMELRNSEGLSQEFIRDIYQDKRLGLREVIEKMQVEAQNEILRDFEKAAKDGAIRKGIKPEFITYFLNKINEMAADEALLPLYENEQELIMELTNFFFYGLGIRDEKQ